jgi:dienelactone hydrolase
MFLPRHHAQKLQLIRYRDCGAFAKHHSDKGFMHFFTAVFAWLLVGLACASGASAETYGAAGAEGASLRAQQWLVPSGDAAVAAHAILFRPAGDGPFRLAVIAHASTQNVLRRAQMPQPDYKRLAAFLVSRGFAVLVPERLGHGATGGPYLEDQGGCEDADYVRSGHATADEIAAALRFMRTQPFVQPDRAIVIGHSAGGWGALALSTSDPRKIAAIIAFAPGRGGHANDRDNEVCAPQALLAAASAFGKAARVPVTWLVAANDSYFSPEFSRRLADAFGASGGKVQFSVLPRYGSEGHWVAESEAGVKLAEDALARALKIDSSSMAKKKTAEKP